jgi:hypothetical protein
MVLPALARRRGDHLRTRRVWSIVVFGNGESEDGDASA